MSYIPPQKTKDSDHRYLKKLIGNFKKDESAAELGLVQLVEDPEAIRLLAAWAQTDTVWVKTKKAWSRSDEDSWDWLWAGTWFDLTELAAKAKLSEPQANRLLQALAGARLIYPDGSLAIAAKEYAEDYAKAKRPKRVGGRPKGARDSYQRPYNKKESK